MFRTVKQKHKNYTMHYELQVYKFSTQKKYFAGPPLLKSGRTGPPRPITPPRPRIILKSASKTSTTHIQCK